ncbi:helix-turn-helix domain-containing protein [Orenia marismortui]|uniref:Winged helix-turn helix protein n=1 Tax=Orenia marismortui TaxID=46469 RepID=A0A4R8GJ92_9FIRM|nr:helix-turn-helix domain-containing protein [Orenia marismortui]TDX42411.1 winged helix-turn helix protein [Orenia marismortui]
MKEIDIRKKAIKKYLAGEKVSNICSDLNRSKTWFYKWYNRYKTKGEEGLKSKSKRPKHSPNKTPKKMEQLIIDIRKRLMNTKYAPIGADSIQWELIRLKYPYKDIPSITTINRIIKRNDLIKRKPQKYKKQEIPYPKPDANHPNKVHQLDIVGPRYIRGSNDIVTQFYSINLIDVYSKMIRIKQYENTKGHTIINFLVNHVWSTIGIPKVLQIDNMMVFKGSNLYPNSPGILTRLCLTLGVEILFIPISEPQRNGTIESFNDTFQKKFLNSQKFDSFEDLKNESDIFVDFFCNQRPYSQLSIKKHGSKLPSEVHKTDNIKLVPKEYMKNFIKENGKYKIPLADGKISFIRFINSKCKLDLFSQHFDVPEKLKYKYLKATIYTSEDKMKVFDQDKQVMEIPYKLYRYK